MTLKIISAEDIVFEGEVTMVSLPGTMGAFTVLHNHASLISTLTEMWFMRRTAIRHQWKLVAGLLMLIIT